jgi:hypothetical protein
MHMNTQTLQHTLSHMLHQLQEEYAHVNTAILALEARLGADSQRRSAGVSKKKTIDKAPKAAGSGGRRSAGWTQDARAEVAERMRAYWRSWREMRANTPAQELKQEKADPSTRMPQGRSTAGWTPQARQQAAARMRARWQKRRTISASPP